MDVQVDQSADLELLAEYRERGDAHAFDLIMQRYSALVYNTCIRILCDRSLAEDATQETFYRLMRKPDQVTKCLPAWLHRAATHLCLDMLRSNTARRAREQAYQAELDRKRDQTPQHWREVYPQLDEAISELPDDTRHILIDHFLMGKSQRELSEINEMSPATMSRRMKTALEELRKRLTSKGIALSISPLLILLTQYEAHAVPLTLSTQLGKLALFSTTTSSAAATSTAAATSGIWLKTSFTFVGGFVLTLAAIGLIGIGSNEPTITVAIDDIHPEANTELNQPFAINAEAESTVAIVESDLPNLYTGKYANANNVFVILHNPSTSLASDLICYISAPHPGDSSLTVTFADTHVQTLSIKEVKRLILKQENRTLSDILSDTSLNTMSQ
ncbi:sigma-70 family RNA polymerase sigma factor [Planctomycetota bacterium]|nr:sigma-70 family RNA polymerase sigma factor [Planctomycetota bacterium]